MTPFLLSSGGLLLMLVASMWFCEATAEWVETARLLDADAEPEDRFGEAVALHNGILAVGAASDDIGTLRNAGSVFMYQLVDGAWSAEAKLVASDAQAFDNFGDTVAVRDGTVAVGVHLENDGGNLAGAVYIFRKDANESWTEEQKLIASDATRYEFFGYSLAMEGSTLIVGAPASFFEATAPGSAYVFASIDGIWTEQAKLTDSNGSESDEFGFAVAISEETLVISSPRDEDRGVESGSVFVYQVAANGLWSEQQKLTPSDGALGLGRAMAIDGGTLCVSGSNRDNGFFSGAVYVFEKHRDSWTQQAKLVSSNPQRPTTFGQELVLKDGVLVVGASSIDSFTGTAFIFGAVLGEWSQQAAITASDGVPGDLFGHGIDFDDGVLVVGAHGVNGRQGLVSTFEKTTNPTASPSSKEAVPTSMPSSQSDCMEIILDFEDFTAGDAPFDLGRGIKVRGDGNRARSGVMVFDTADPTGGDEDLASMALGKILILPEDRSTTEPNSNELGGYIRFAFDPPVAEVLSVDLKDFDTDGSSITGKYADGSKFPKILVEPSENGGEQTVTIEESSVSRLKINLAGSGGIDNLKLVSCGSES